MVCSRLCSGRAGLGDGSGWRCPSGPGTGDGGRGEDHAIPALSIKAEQVRAGRDGMKWLSVCWWALLPTSRGTRLPAWLACVGAVPRSSRLRTETRLKLALPWLGPISRISLRLFQLSNPSIRLQNPPRLHCGPAVIESPASQLSQRPRCPVLEPFPPGRAPFQARGDWSDRT